MNYLGEALRELDENLDNDSQLFPDSEKDMFYWSVKLKLCNLFLENKMLAYGALQDPGGGFMINSVCMFNGFMRIKKVKQR